MDFSTKTWQQVQLRLLLILSLYILRLLLLLLFFLFNGNLKTKANPAGDPQIPMKILSPYAYLRPRPRANGRNTRTNNNSRSKRRETRRRRRRNGLTYSIVGRVVERQVYWEKVWCLISREGGRPDSALEQRND